MGLSFVMGIPGCGKSTSLYQKAIENALQPVSDTEYIFLVPDQSTFQVQQDLLRLHPNHVIGRTDVLGFTRFAYKTFTEAGMQVPPVMDEIGKTMILRKVANELSPELTLYRKSLDRPGFIDELQSILSEMKQYKIDSEVLKKAKESPGLTPTLKLKFHELNLFLTAFDREMGEKYITVEELMTCLARAVPKAEQMRNRIFVLDGFTGFTPIQYDVIRELMLCAKEVIVVLNARNPECLEQGGETSSPDRELFRMSGTAYRKLCAIAGECNGSVPCSEPVFLGKAEPETGAELTLDMLEQSFGAVGMSEKQMQENARRLMENGYDGFTVTAYSGMENEVDGVGRKIENLIRMGYRYRDIGVIMAGNTEEYLPIVRKTFDSMKMPFFIDEKKSIMAHPVVSLVLYAVEMFEEKFDIRTVFAYLKSGLSDLQPAEVDFLENYCLANGIRGYGKWKKKWTKVYPYTGTDELELINEIRKKFMDEIEPLAPCFAGSEDVDVETRIRAIYDFLTRIHVAEKVNVLAQEAAAAGQGEFARESEQVYRILMNLFDTFVSLMGDEVMTNELFLEIMKVGLSKVKVGLVPPAIDRLVVGDIRRSRLNNIKVLFLLGMNDGVIPAPVDKGGIFSEADRHRIEKGNLFELAPNGREDMLIQEYYCYLAFTRAKQAIHVSYSLSNSDGKQMKTSFYLNQILKNPVFKGFRSLKESSDITTEDLTSPEHDIRYLIPKGKWGQILEKNVEAEDWWKGLFAWFHRNQDMSYYADMVQKGLLFFYDDSTIRAASAAALYGENPFNSVTQLEKFAECPFAHFMQYGLLAGERAEYSLEATDLGNLYHYCMEKVAQNLMAEGKEWGSLLADEQATEQLVHRLIYEDYKNDKKKSAVREDEEEIIYRSDFDIFEENAINRNLLKKAEKVLVTSVLATAYQMSLGKFRTECAELAFGKKKEDGTEELIPPVTLKLENGMLMRIQGRIDRIDVSDASVEGFPDLEGGEEPGRVFFLNVVDYKSGQQKPDPIKMKEGLQLQLAIYMRAAVDYLQNSDQFRDKKIKMGGIYYFHFDDPFLKDSKPEYGHEEIMNEVFKKMKLTGKEINDINYIRHLETEIKKNSRVASGISVLKEGTVGDSRTSTMPEEEFAKMIDQAQEKAKSLADRIMAGDVDVNPYRLKKNTACDFCPYHSVCGFDMHLKGYHYRKLG